MLDNPKHDAIAKLDARVNRSLYPTFLTPADVAEILNKKMSWVYVALKDGALKGVHVGGNLRIKDDELKRYIASLPIATFEPNRAAKPLTSANRAG
jgi:excisionase family DNA binding protein